MLNVRMSEKGGVIIPAAMRKKYGLLPGMNLRVVDYGGVISIIPVSKDPIHEAAGMFKGGPSLTQILVEERIKEREREDR